MTTRRLTCLCLTAALLMTTLQAIADTLPVPEGKVLLSVSGKIGKTNVDSEAHFDRTMLEALPRQTLHTSTVVTDGVNRFEGFLMSDLLAHVGAQGERAEARALNDYVVDIPLEDFRDFEVLVADSMDGERLTPRDKGPLWIVYPRDDHSELQDIRYDYRWVWQLESLDIR
ncbi:molybdopterin-dependent oxidoreductase [Billgrantia montanilacus]|nr:molybdopterin-dependent oxidoreductase [Halomonas montanilacus]